ARTTDRHPQLVTLRRHLGEMMAAQRDLDGADRSLRAAWTDAVSLYGNDQPETLAIRRLRATLALQRGDLAEAEAALQQV
ncbi:hypothetical protein, partial [Stenotrophomonas sp. SrG]|uniref:hypothetical protein n=1 Tax=Stenotrophomonas sp. SrG TaxID=3414430 RepID=UPI003CF7339D